MGMNKNLEIRLKEQADRVANLVGLGKRYDVKKAGEDFIKYLREHKAEKLASLSCLPTLRSMRLIDFPNEMTDFFQAMAEYGGGMTGHGNPYSPIIIASSEHAHNFHNLWDTYFKALYDFFWMYQFNIGPQSVLKKRHDELKEFWCGANEDTSGVMHYPTIPLRWKFYSTMRAQMEEFENDYPFCVYVTLYHTFRGQGGDQWKIIDRLKRCLINNYRPETSYVSKPTFKDFKLNNDFNKKNCLENYKKYIPIDELFFFTECNLIPSKKTEGSESLKNDFLLYILENFKAPRIIIYNPGKNKRKEEFFKAFKAKRIFLISPKQKKQGDIEAYLYKNKNNCNKLIIQTRNLTGDVSNRLLNYLARCIQFIGGYVHYTPQLPI